MTFQNFIYLLEKVYLRDYKIEFHQNSYHATYTIRIHHLRGKTQDISFSADFIHQLLTLPVEYIYKELEIMKKQIYQPPKLMKVFYQ